jgi:hypothetical protein
MSQYSTLSQYFESVFPQEEERDLFLQTISEIRKGENRLILLENQGASGTTGLLNFVTFSLSAIPIPERTKKISFEAYLDLIRDVFPDNTIVTSYHDNNGLIWRVSTKEPKIVKIPMRGRFSDPTFSLNPEFVKEFAQMGLVA